jgi:hypothetical protein
MTIYYLYVKTHNITGLKYLGKTSSKDPHKYQGSGIYWKSHIKKHGYDVTTEIIKECQNNYEVRIWGEHYSTLWDVVNNDDWANLKPENGDGGFILSPASIAKRTKTRIANGNANTNTPESIAKGIATKKENGTYGRNYSTSESAKRAAETRKRNGKHLQSQDSINKQINTKIKNGTLNTSTSLSIAKANETKLKNGTNKRTKESIEKQVATILANGGRIQTEETRRKLRKPKERLVCPHCNLSGGNSQIKRWHFDKCKLKSM